MQLTRQTDYGFRILMYVINMQQEKTTVHEIATALELSKPNVMKVVSALSAKGWINSIRGNNGGIYLGTDPSQITLREVVETMEVNLEPINCEVPKCNLSPSCMLKPFLLDARDAFLSSLSKHTVAELANKSTTELIANISISSSWTDKLAK